MIKSVIIITICISTLCSCNTPKDMSLYYNNHLNDTSHVDNSEIKKQKEEVFKQIVNFDKWYRDNYKKIIFHEGNKYWNINYYQDKEDTMRLRILKEKVIPSIPKCHYITEKLKNKALKNAEADDPQNLGFILTGNDFGKSLRNFSFFEYAKFNWPEFLDSDRLKSEWDESPDRVISQEEALFYHLTMIKLVDNNNAIYRVHTGMTNAPMSKYAYLVVALIKVDNQWLIDNMYYIPKEELIDDPRDTKGLIDYISTLPG